MTIRRYIIRGRSIDGTVYASPRGCMGNWVFSRSNAVKLTLRDAQAIVAARIARNRTAAPDDMIGRLVIVPANRLAESRMRAMQDETGV